MKKASALLVAMIWKGMSGSGAMIGIVIIMKEIPIIPLKGLILASTVCCAAAPGSTTPGTVGLPFASTAGPATAAALASAFPEVNELRARSAERRELSCRKA